MYPDRVVGLQQRVQHARKFRVHPAIAFIVTAIEGGEVDAVVKKRPQATVGEAIVVFFMFFRREIDRRECKRAHFLDLRAVVAALVHLAAPAVPEPAARLQRIDKRDRETARPRGILDRTDTVGDDDKAAHTCSSHLRLRRIAVFMIPTSE